MIEVRYNLLEVIDTAIAYNLEKEELLSAVFTEVNFKETTNSEWILAVQETRLYFKIKELSSFHKKEKVKGK